MERGDVLGLVSRDECTGVKEHLSGEQGNTVSWDLTLWKADVVENSSLLHITPCWDQKNNLSAVSSRTRETRVL